MKIFFALTIFFLYINVKAQTSSNENISKDSISNEYIRVTYLWAKFTAYYEDGRVEDLKATLNLNAHGIITDQKLTGIFFKISRYFQKKGYYLVTASGVYAPSSASASNEYCEYIYRKSPIR